LTRKMAGCANAIAAVGRELGRINHGSAARDMRFTRAMAALAGNTGLAKGRRGITVLRARDGFKPTRMTRQAGGLYGARQKRIGVTAVCGREIPTAAGAVIRYW